MTNSRSWLLFAAPAAGCITILVLHFLPFYIPREGSDVLKHSSDIDVDALGPLQHTIAPTTDAFDKQDTTNFESKITETESNFNKNDNRNSEGNSAEASSNKSDAPLVARRPFVLKEAPTVVRSDFSVIALKQPGSNTPKCLVHCRRYADPCGRKQLGGQLPPMIYPCYVPQGPKKRRLSAGSPEENSTGAWVLSENACYHLDLKFIESLSKIVGDHTLTELGAGKGCYTAYMKANGVKVVVAVDGAKNIGKLTGGLVKTWDLTRPLGAQADWVMSLEVAEHIPRQFEDAFLDNVVRNARCYVLLSWSKYSGKGSGHVNPRDKDYVDQRMKEFGFMLAPELMSWLGRRGVWFIGNKIRVYYREGCEEPKVPANLQKKGK